MNNKNTGIGNISSGDWEIYSLLSNLINHNHNRFIDNYKIFLAFNSFLIPASTALLGYAFKEKISLLHNLVSLICIVGILFSYLGFKLLKRITLDSELRLKQLIEIEKKIKGLTVYPYTEGKDFFFKNKSLSDERFYVLKKCKDDKGTRGIDAYKYFSVIIIVLYVILAILPVFIGR